MSDPTSFTMDAPIVHALRQGASIDHRIANVTIEDKDGAEYDVPLRTVESVDADGSTTVTVEVARDLIAFADERASGPLRRRGTVQIGSLESLVAYINKYKGDTSVAFAAPNKPGIEAVLDYHPGGDSDNARWCQDRVSYACPFSRQWKAWTEAEGKPRGQVEFGDFLEANEVDLASREGFASAATMITVARNLVVNSVGKFSRTVNPTTGEGSLIVKDEHDASTSTPIPKGFALAIPVFEGTTDLYPVEARLRFSMDGGRPSFSFILANKELVLEHALAALRKQVADGTGIPVYVGQAPAPATGGAR